MNCPVLSPCKRVLGDGLLRPGGWRLFLAVSLQACACGKAFGQLVSLGLRVAALAPATYRRSRLLRPCVEILS